MKLFLSKTALKEFSKLPQTEKKKAANKIDILRMEPFVGKKLTGELKEKRSLSSWPYRIIYYIKENKKEIWIEHIIHRQGAYK
jgi:mRNA-degrading endonuclease RelE of RelBE toxin-antitoxin system